MKLSVLATRILDQISPERTFATNVLGTNFEKSVLISYITPPFSNGRIKFTHSSSVEVREIGKIFSELGYNVDIIRYNCDFEKVKFIKDKYDVVFGIEPNFLKAVTKFKPKKSIYYATGAYCKFQNEAETARLNQLKNRRGILLAPARKVAEHNSSDMADGVICFGNDWTKSTYLNHNKKIEMIRISAFSHWNLKNISARDFSSAKKHFLWFGSIGAVHKGLDLLLEIFPKHPNLTLHICGNVEKEKDFIRLYRREFIRTKNIIFHGWINPDSAKYKKIVETCAFTILPSCSESMNGAVPTGMYTGLIPLVSRECGLNVNQSGEIFSDNSIETIEKTIKKFSHLDSSELAKLSKSAFLFARDNNAIESFKADFDAAISQLL
ncbi:MAG: glycosyltransferase [Candidatus Berkelbacteria bacterium]